MCHSREAADQVNARLAAWLAPRALVFNEDKTRIVHAETGFDFLGFNVRRYRSGKLLNKPIKTAIKRIRERLRGEVRAVTVRVTLNASDAELTQPGTVTAGLGLEVNGFSDNATVPVSMTVQAQAPGAIDRH